MAAVDGRAPFAPLDERLRAAQAEVADVAAELRRLGEGIDDDPERLAAIRDRRQLLVELRRKYGAAPSPDGSEGGSGTLADVIAYHAALQQRLADLEGHDARAAMLDARAQEAAAEEATAAAEVGRAWRAAAGPLARAVEAHLGELAMGSARAEVAVGDADPGDEVTFLLAANPGATAGPLARVASGGELAGTMLALRLVLSMAPPVLVFDEVDAGIGGQAGWPWVAPGRPRCGPPGARRDPPAAGGRLRRRPDLGAQAGARGSDRGHGARPRRRRSCGRALPDAVGHPGERAGPRGRPRAARARRRGAGPVIGRALGPNRTPRLAGTQRSGRRHRARPGDERPQRRGAEP
ncbi:MAG: hypothetical protein R2711_03540 [Acidimicrobiales bacterium]